MLPELSSDLEQFLEQEISSGHFSSRSAVIEHALRMMKRERDEAVAGIKAGLDDVAAGRTQPLAAAIGDLRKEFGVSGDS